ncbi:hypothetical protein LTR84_003637 [Exophiala bonariae]|uniref:SMODS and SLOG-associating 2TM effector domain-containing protein n=1 Tax=Exophiala bonariae TaxID=1690606 RepID=A0AAV9NAD7_9EURO|nr:hypothetical protein LTR84_003637 [Exophiala bonariae]
MPNSSMPWLHENFTFPEYDFNYSRSSFSLAAEVILNVTLGIIMALLNTVTVLHSLSSRKQPQTIELYGGAILIVKYFEEVRQTPNQTMVRPSNTPTAEAPSPLPSSSHMPLALSPQDISTSSTPISALPAPTPVAAATQHRRRPPPQQLFNLQPRMSSQGYSSSWTI